MSSAAGLEKSKLVVSLGLVVAGAIIVAFLTIRTGGGETAANFDSILGDPEIVARLDTVTGIDVVKAYEENSVAATERFEDRPVFVRGTVDRVRGDRERASVYFGYFDSDDRLRLFSFPCILTGEATNSVIELSSGEEIVMVGLVEKTDSSFRVRPCRIVESRQ